MVHNQKIKMKGDIRPWYSLSTSGLLLSLVTVFFKGLPCLMDCNSWSLAWTGLPFLPPPPNAGSPGGGGGGGPDRVAGGGGGGGGGNGIPISFSVLHTSGKTNKQNDQYLNRKSRGRWCRRPADGKTSLLRGCGVRPPERCSRGLSEWLTRHSGATMSKRTVSKRWRKTEEDTAGSAYRTSYHIRLTTRWYVSTAAVAAIIDCVSTRWTSFRRRSQRW